MVKYTDSAYLSAVEENEIKKCLTVDKKKYNKNETIMQLSEFDTSSKRVGLVDTGCVHLVKIDFSGQKSILDYYEAGNIFGRSLHPVIDDNNYFFQAKEKTTVIYLDYGKLIMRCDRNCDKHVRFINNLVFETMRRSNTRINILSQRSIRDKLLLYFRYLNNQKHTDMFILPLTLSDLAEYLSVDRSAMMREIKKLNDEKIIISKGKEIQLL